MPIAFAMVGSKEVINNSLKKSRIRANTNVDTPSVSHLSKSCTAKILPNKIWNKSVELLATPISITPKAKKELKVMPIAVSPLIVLLFFMKVMITDDSSPKKIAQ